jgi:outer membrane receptor protein involved in Fe transport
VAVGVDNARRDDVGVFAGLSHDIGRWGLSAGLRADRVTSKNRGGYFGDHDSTNSGVSGFFSLSFDVTDQLQLTGQVAQGFRDAVLSDRYYRGITGRGFITGNPDLEPESSLQYDLAIRYRSNRFDVAGYAYLYRIDDVIERYGIGDNYFFRNGGLAEITGVEIDGGFDLGRGLSLRAGVHSLRGEAGPESAPTDDVPAPGVFALLRGEPNHRWWWMVRLAAFARDDRPGPTEREVPGYELLDAGVTYRVNDALQLQLLGRNLLDSSYLGSADEDAVLAPGRSIQLSLSGKL